MLVAIFNWRDLGHPGAGGAETSTHTLAQGLAQRGHSVVWFTSRFSDQPTRSRRDGYEVIRSGSQLTCRFNALDWLARNRHRLDVVIDEVNTLPFFSSIVAKEKLVLWMHQLAREVWRAEAPGILGAIGYASERWMLELYRNVPVMTVSESSAKSIREFKLGGPVSVAENALRGPLGFSTTTRHARVGYVGRLAPSKRVDHIINAFAQLRTSIPEATLAIIGSGDESEVSRLKRFARQLHVSDAVEFMGRVTDKERDDVLNSLDVLAMASMREGWGLVVSEAARYGVPSVVYPVPGLVDSVVNGRTGVITDSPCPESLARSIEAVVCNRDLRNSLGRNAMEYIVQFTERRFLDKFERLLLERAKPPKP